MNEFATLFLLRLGRQQKLIDGLLEVRFGEFLLQIDLVKHHSSSREATDLPAGPGSVRALPA